jgi:hypothetical protein
MMYTVHYGSSCCIPQLNASGSLLSAILYCIHFTLSLLCSDCSPSHLPLSALLIGVILIRISVVPMTSGHFWRDFHLAHSQEVLLACNGSRLLNIYSSQRRPHPKKKVAIVQCQEHRVQRPCFTVKIEGGRTTSEHVLGHGFALSIWGSLWPPSQKHFLKYIKSSTPNYKGNSYQFFKMWYSNICAPLLMH